MYRANIYLTGMIIYYRGELLPSSQKQGFTSYQSYHKPLLLLHDLVLLVLWLYGATWRLRAVSEIFPSIKGLPRVRAVLCIAYRLLPLRILSLPVTWSQFVVHNPPAIAFFYTSGCWLYLWTSLDKQWTKIKFHLLSNKSGWPAYKSRSSLKNILVFFYCLLLLLLLSLLLLLLLFSFSLLSLLSILLSLILLSLIYYYYYYYYHYCYIIIIIIIICCCSSSYHHYYYYR